MKIKDKERANRIIEIYKDVNLNQKKFAELIGVSQQLVSAVLNYSKKPNETILFAIIDNITNVDPIWLLTGKGKYKNNYVPQDNVSTSIDTLISNMVKKHFDQINLELNQRLSNIEELISKTNAKNILRRIDQDNSKLVSELKKDTKNLGS
ncbi:helix-turn-helix transcriptional regulator [uncultured Polaribacter sp.]|uniref:helix-turn-helix domain-containing protein n=1 Tax=uncultured Polaribacter sp. TaxID=174711 RepID=UPI0026170B24|nr:helix-turn-helix transcriptional regulator [uncultured Polaribacter sp.]